MAEGGPDRVDAPAGNFDDRVAPVDDMGVVALAPDQTVRAAPAGKRVVAGLTRKRVVARSAVQRIVADKSGDPVGQRGSRQNVIAGGRIELGRDPVCPHEIAESFRQQEISARSGRGEGDSGFKANVVKAGGKEIGRIVPKLESGILQRPFSAWQSLKIKRVGLVRHERDCEGIDILGDLDFSGSRNTNA